MEQISDGWVVVNDVHQHSGQRLSPKLLPPSTGDLLSQVSRIIEDMSDELRTISLNIHDDPELRFKERHAHDLLTSFVRSQDGWEVTPSAYGLETAFVAVCEGSASGPVVSFNAEYGSHLQ